MSFESSHRPATVAEFYRTALSRYGVVLDCGSVQPATTGVRANSAALTCDDGPDPGGWLLKAGTQHAQHIVVVKPAVQGAVFQLVYIEDVGKK